MYLASLTDPAGEHGLFALAASDGPLLWALPSVPTHRVVQSDLQYPSALSTGIRHNPLLGTSFVWQEPRGLGEFSCQSQRISCFPKVQVVLRCDSKT